MMMMMNCRFFFSRVVIVVLALAGWAAVAVAGTDVVTGNGTQGKLSVAALNAEGLNQISEGCGWVISTTVENNGASFNQWGSCIFALGGDAFPEKNGYKGVQLYLQSASNGGKLNAVFNGGDHTIDNVAYNEGFSARLSYDGKRALTIYTKDAAGNEDTKVFELNAALGSFSQLAYGLPTGMNIKALTIESVEPEDEAKVKYGVALMMSDGKAAPEGAGVVYGGKRYDSTFSAAEGLTTGVVGAALVSGYRAEVTFDAAERTFTVVYSANRRVENPEAVAALLNRIGGAGTAERLETLLDEDLFEGESDVFVIGAKGGKPLVKGSSVSAITTGIGWYLNHYMNVNIAWNSLNECGEGAYAELGALRMPEREERHVCVADYRYYLNYCTFGYSMTSWTWARWQKEIDWMALHGINMPLQIIGLEKVWREFLMHDLTACGGTTNYSEANAEAFVPGPAFTAWWGMNNLEGWGGDGSNAAGGMRDNAWYDRQAALARQICDRERELGMQPVLPGFSGMVPSNFKSVSGLNTETANKWCGFQRPAIVDPTGEAFAALAAKYYERLREVMGTSKYYSMDPFHEGGTISSGRYAEGFRAVYDAMDRNCGSNTQWVIQQWQWAGYQGSSLTAVPAGRLVVLDLFSDGSPGFDRWAEGYSPQRAVYCTIPNFGGRSGLMGRLQNMTDNYFKYKDKYATIRGVGAAPEAIEQTPVTYDLLFELPWHGTKPDVDAWIRDYATSRYGKVNSAAQGAWATLKATALNYGADAIQGPVEDVWAAIPNLACNPASAWGSTYNNAKAAAVNTPEMRRQLIGAVEALLAEDGVLGGSNYEYDLVELCGAVLADYAYDLLKAIKTAKDEGNADAYEVRTEKFLQLILDVDALKGTNTNFRLGKWTKEARDAAAEVSGAKTATADWYEEANARTILTTWGDWGQSVAGGQASLRDYSYRSWQGLMRDVYYPRWKYYFDHNCQHPGNNQQNWFYFEWNWAHRRVYAPGDMKKATTRLAAGDVGYEYSPVPEGSTVEVARELLRRYFFKEGDAYKYRYVEDDLSLSVREVPEAAVAAQDSVYDLSGRRVNAGDAQGGIYVMGGIKRAVR